MGGGTATNCFYNSDVFTESTSYGTGQTTAQMKTASTYTDWDFDTVWTISSINDGYPFLQAFEQVMYVFTGAISDISYNKASADGELRNMDVQTAIAYGFCWSSTNTLPSVVNDTVNLGTASAETLFSDTITGLSPSTTYYIRAYAITASDTVYGGVVNFTTKPEYPEVTTLDMGTVTAATAILNGEITWAGTSAITAYGFCWSSTDTLPSFADNITNLGTASAEKTFTYTISGLTGGTTYYLRSYATNASGTGYGTVVSFHTVLKGSGSSSNP
jgi:hypothetical protein